MSSDIIQTNKVKLGLSLMPSLDYEAASEQLFMENRVQAIEYSFDNSFIGKQEKPWFEDLLDKYSQEDALLGHGVTLSPLSAALSKRQENWLARTATEFSNRSYKHATEHFGFSQAGAIAHGPPLPVPMTPESLRIGREMMRRMADAMRVPVGLENLALAFNMDDVKKQGDFIDQLISEVDGFILLDLHNIYCQVANFRVSELDLLRSYPLSKVREIHISGGSWSHSMSGQRAIVRRDTHDEAVPQEVFNLLMLALKLCPNVEFVMLERLAMTMPEPEDQEGFREDFATLEEILEAHYA